MELKTKLKNSPFRDLHLKPCFFNLSKKKDQSALKKLINKNKVTSVIDDYQEQLREYFEIKNANLVFSPNINKIFEDFCKKIIKKKPFIFQGKWVYFPWSQSLIHILEEEAYFKVRTGRNRNLVTEREQKKFYESKIGVAGLSVGNSVALAIALQGGAKHIRLADPDRLALSNTNRIRAGISSLGLLKVEITARQIYEINPYSHIETFAEGLNEKNISKFCEGLNIIVDEVDNWGIKFLLRVQAKKRKTPLVMAADNGENGLIDIERYDLNQKTKFFNGRLGKVTYNDLKRLDKFSTGKLIVKHLGPENISKSTWESFLQMGKTLVSWPQLGGAATLNGSALAYCIRKIVNKQSVISNRGIISLDEILSSPKGLKILHNRNKKSEKEIKMMFKI